MTKSKLHIAATVLISVLFTSMTAQEISVTAAFDTTYIFIGDQTGFTFTVDQPGDITLNLPEFRDTLIKNIEVLAGPVTDTTIRDDGNIRITERYLITSFDSGSYVIDPVFAELSGEDGLRRFYSDYSYLRVMRVNLTPPDTTTGIFDIVAPYKAPVTAAEVLPWVLIAAVAAVILWFIFKIVKRLRKKETAQAEPVIKDPPHIIAFRELEKLRYGQLWQKGEIKPYYSRLTEILRQYIEDRYGVFSLELTTDETLRALLRTGFKKDAVYDLLRSVLTDADLVKFAKHKPSLAEHDICFNNAWQFVSDTVEKAVNEAASGKMEDEKRMEATR